MTTTRTPLGDLRTGVLFHVLGDMHFGASPQWRADAISQEFVRGAIETPNLHLQVGDNTENGLAAEFVRYIDFHNRLPAQVLETLGNHDLNGVTSAVWASTLGYSTANYFRDFGTYRLIVVAADQATPTQLSVATLQYLGDRLGETALPCVVMTHYPIYNTVGGDSSLEYTSTAANMFICSAARTTDSNDILAVLGAHSNLKLYICGHTHSRLTVPALVTKVSIGSVNFACVNASSPYYQGLDHNALLGGALDNCHSLFINWDISGGRVDVRFRDHGAGQWVAPNGNSVISVTGL